MKRIPSRIIVLFAITAFGFLAGAEEKPADKAAPKNAGFEKIKTLAGEWQVSHAPGEHGEHGGTVSYKVTAGGSAVLETLFAGTDHEMVTLYYMEGDDLSLTHYCMLHNRPLMRAERSTNANKIVFKCSATENAKIMAEDHMHQATFTFVDADHFKSEWQLYKSGKPDATHGFEFARKKK